MEPRLGLVTCFYSMHVSIVESRCKSRQGCWHKLHGNYFVD
jgi:hypothetical protein